MVAGDISSYVREVCRDLELEGVRYGVSVGEGKAYATSLDVVLSGSSCTYGVVSIKVSIIIDLRPSNLSTACRTVPMLFLLLSNILKLYQADSGNSLSAASLLPSKSRHGVCFPYDMGPVSRRNNEKPMH